MKIKLPGLSLLGPRAFEGYFLYSWYFFFIFFFFNFKPLNATDLIISIRIYTSVYFKQINKVEDLILINIKQTKEIGWFEKEFERKCM